jgi:tetratricopeptide (TPR) repeat protein
MTTSTLSKSSKSRRVSWTSMLAGLVLGAGIMLVSLAQAGRIAPPPQPEVLVALAQTLEVEHKRVDLLLAQKDYPGAIAALEGLRKIDWPGRQTAGEAADQLRHDAYGRLVRLRLDHPTVDARTPEQLGELVREGLGDDYKSLGVNAFTARLVALRGEVAEKKGDDDAALTAYDEALTMNRGLLQRALAGAGQ